LPFGVVRFFVRIEGRQQFGRHELPVTLPTGDFTQDVRVDRRFRCCPAVAAVTSSTPMACWGVNSGSSKKASTSFSVSAELRASCSWFASMD
jgi:hypothetical protein